MSEPTQLVVGIPVFNEEDFEELKGKYCDCHGYNLKSHKNCAFCDKKGYNRNHEKCIQFYGAGYDIYTKELPIGIVGLSIFKTWNDALEITDKVLQEIELAKLEVKNQFSPDNYKAKIFVIGGTGTIRAALGISLDSPVSM